MRPSFPLLEPPLEVWRTFGGTKVSKHQLKKEASQNEEAKVSDAPAKNEARNPKNPQNTKAPPQYDKEAGEKTVPKTHYFRGLTCFSNVNGFGFIAQGVEFGFNTIANP